MLEDVSLTVLPSYCWIGELIWAMLQCLYLQLLLLLLVVNLQADPLVRGCSD